MVCSDKSTLSSSSSLSSSLLQYLRSAVTSFHGTYCTVGNGFKDDSSEITLTNAFELTLLITLCE